MEILKSFKRLLNSPFLGSCDPLRELRIYFFVGIFITTFLYFFQPYGINQYRGNLLFLTASLGMATLVGGFSFFVVVTYVLNVRQDHPGFTFWKWMVYTFVLLIVITGCNYLVLTLYEGNASFRFDRFFFLFLETAAIGVFPITFYGLITYFRNQSRFQQEAATFVVPSQTDSPSPYEVIHLPSRYAESLTCPPNDLYFLEAQDNYVAVRYRLTDELKTDLLRNSLSEINEQLPSSYFFRCHRSFIVNLQKIREISGNAQGLVLTLVDFDLQVPVSRTYIQELKELINRA